MTDGQLWIFALLRRDHDTRGWTTLVSPLQDLERIYSEEETDEYICPLPDTMELLLRWVSVRGKIDSLNLTFPDQ